MMNRLAAIGILFALVAFHGTQPAAGEDFDGTRAEKELITLLNSIDEQYKTFRHKSRAMDDPDQQAEFRKTSDPAHECVPTLLAFEDQNRGTLVGLMALRRIVDMAGRRGHVGNPSAQGRRKVLNRLSNYVDRPELLAILGHLGSGTFEPRVADTLRTIAEDEGADPLVRGYSKLTLGRWMLNVRDKHEFSERRIHALSEGVAPRFPTEMQFLGERLESLPAAALTQAWQKEAVEILRQVVDAQEQLFIPEVEGIDPDWYLLRIVEDSTAIMRRLADLAEGSLFKESHLRLGKMAPDLEVKLISSENWSMAEQRDKAVIVQFSFKNCGPCERMYPNLRELQQEYGERLSILSVMVDKQQSNAEESVADGSVTWHIHWEGHRGPIAMRWAVRGYPTVYVVDPQGKIAGVRLRGEELKKKIAELLN